MAFLDYDISKCWHKLKTPPSKLHIVLSCKSSEV